jgi:hypothetical protein
VQTPVGARCRECARLYRLPTYRVSTVYYMRAAFTAIGAAAACGALWGYLDNVIPYFYIFNIILGGAIGYACAEVISLVVNRKRGVGLAIVAGAAVLLAYMVAIIVPWGFTFSFFDLLAIAAGIVVAVTRIR